MRMDVVMATVISAMTMPTVVIRAGLDLASPMGDMPLPLVPRMVASPVSLRLHIQQHQMAAACSLMWKPNEPAQRCVGSFSLIASTCLS